MPRSALPFCVLRRCKDGECPCSDDRCACVEPVVDVDVDELTDAELDHFEARGNKVQRELAAVRREEEREGELLAGQRDVMPPLARGGLAPPCETCARELRCIQHSLLQYEGF